MTLKSRSGVTQGHRKWPPFDSLHMLSYYRPIVTLCVKCTVFEIFTFQNYRDLETPVRGHSRSSKLTPFNSLRMVSYYRSIVTLCLKCTVFEIWRHIGWNLPKKPNLPSFGTFFWGDPLRIFRWIIPCQKLEWRGYQMVYISRSCFRSARHNTGVWQTDGQTDKSLSQNPR